jgi:hypothetical protein
MRSMIVPWHDPEEMVQVHDFDSSPQFYSGCVSGLDDRETSDKPPRPIGFRMPEPEPVVEDPSWMLL